MQRFAHVASKNEEFDFEGFLEKYKKIFGLLILNDV